jgi:hypothetical protein
MSSVPSSAAHASWRAHCATMTISAPVSNLDDLFFLTPCGSLRVAVLLVVGQTHTDGFYAPILVMSSIPPATYTTTGVPPSTTGSGDPALRTITFNGGQATVRPGTPGVCNSPLLGSSLTSTLTADHRCWRQHRGHPLRRPRGPGEHAPRQRQPRHARVIRPRHHIHYFPRRARADWVGQRGTCSRYCCSRLGWWSAWCRHYGRWAVVAKVARR